MSQRCKILVMGLPGSGKTWLASRLARRFSIPFWDADVVREIYNDWDFSVIGRALQTERMRELAEIDPISISAYVCPLPALRFNFRPDKIVWMDTIDKGRYEDTNELFRPPLKNHDLRVTRWIEEDQLYRCLEGFSLGIEDTLSFSDELMLRLAKCV